MNDQKMMMAALTIFILALAVASVFTKHWSDMKTGIWEKDDHMSAKKKEMMMAIKALSIAFLALLAVNAALVLVIPHSRYAVFSGAVLLLAGLCGLAAFSIYAVEFTQKEPVKHRLSVSAYGMLAASIISVLHAFHMMVCK